MSDIQDVVYVADADGNQVFVGARPLRAFVREGAYYPEHPVETGTVITDNVIFPPINIELHLILDPGQFVSVFGEIRGYFRNATKLSVQTKVAVYDGMYIEEMPHDEDAERFDTVAVALKLKQVIIVEAQVEQLPNATDPADKSTTQTGQKQGAAASPAQSSAAFSLIFGGP